MGVTNFIWDEASDNVLYETNENDAVIASYTHRPEPFGELLSQRRTNRDFYYHLDGASSTRKITNDSEAVVKTYIFSGFGEEILASGVTANPFGYKGAVGYYTDEETGDIYVRERTYDPVTGRWLSKDPLGFVEGPNLYSAHFAPSDADPLGWQTIPSGPIIIMLEHFQVFPHDLGCPGDCPQKHITNWTAYGCFCGLGNPPPDVIPIGPIDHLDWCCEVHDKCYEANGCPPYVQGGDEHGNEKCRECDQVFCRCVRVATCNRHPVNPPRRKLGEPRTTNRGDCESFRQLTLSWFDCEFRFGITIPLAPDIGVWTERRKRIP